MADPTVELPKSAQPVFQAIARHLRKRKIAWVLMPHPTDETQLKIGTLTIPEAKEIMRELRESQSG